MNDKLVDGDVNVKFVLYVQFVGLMVFYEEMQLISFCLGYFFVYVGDGGDLDLSLFCDYLGFYLGMIFGGDEEMQLCIFLVLVVYVVFV